MTEQERNAAFTAKLPELVAVVKELHSLAKLSFPNDNPYLNSRFGTYGRYLRRNQRSVQIFPR